MKRALITIIIIGTVAALACGWMLYRRLSTNHVTANELATESLGLGIPIQDICTTEPIKELSTKLPSSAIYTGGSDEKISEGDGFDWYQGEGFDKVQCHIGRTKTLLPGQRMIAAVISINCAIRPVDINPQGAGSAYVTNKGVHLGDDRAKVFKCYGLPKRPAVLVGNTERFYYSADGCLLDFEIDHETNRVMSMMLTMVKEW